MILGADGDRLDVLGDRLAAAGAASRALVRVLEVALAATRWSGPDRDRFGAEHSQHVERLAFRLAGDLEAAAEHVRREARQQRVTSRADVEPPAGAGARGGAAPGAGAGRAAFTLLDDPEHGRRIVSIGDPSIARHVVVLVGGIGTDLTNFGAQVDHARAVHRLADAERPGDVAVIAWLGYAAPSGFDRPALLGDALSRDRAIAGASRLRAFVTSLERAPGAATPDVTLIGHSYGSIVVTAAARGNPDVDRVVVLGSPGVGATGLAGLDLAADTQLFAGAARSDLVSHSQWFGVDPASARFGGAIRFDATGPGPLGRDHPHSSYFEPGSDALANLARIAVGADPTAEVPSPVEVWFGDASSDLARFRFGIELLDAATPGRAADVATAAARVPLEVADRSLQIAAGLGEGVEDLLLDRLTTDR